VLEHVPSMTKPHNSAPRCVFPGCQKTPVARLQDNARCQEHFLAACHTRLAEISHLIDRKRLDGTEAQEIRSFLAECTSTAVSRALESDKLNNRQRAEFLHIVLTSAQVLMRLRRSARVERQIPLRLVGDPRTNPRIEDAMTETVSKHGAMVSCEHPYTKGQIVDVVRLDTGRSAIARIAWHRPLGPAQHQVAVEILNRTNFWT
jgi:PilZ domain